VILLILVIIIALGWTIVIIGISMTNFVAIIFLAMLPFILYPLILPFQTGFFDYLLMQKYKKIGRIPKNANISS